MRVRKKQPQLCYIFGKKGRSRKITRIVHAVKNGKGTIVYQRKSYPVKFVEATDDEPSYWIQDTSREAVPLQNTIIARNPIDGMLGEVISVGDGDTFKVKRRFYHRGESFIIRLAWLDAPESDQVFGKEARDKLAELLPKGSIVQICAFKRDKYKRLIAEVFLDGESINLKLVREGFAVIFSKFFSGCPNKEEYQKAEALAKWHQINFWSQDNPVMPWDHREQKRQKQLAKRITKNDTGK